MKALEKKNFYIREKTYTFYHWLPSCRARLSGGSFVVRVQSMKPLAVRTAEALVAARKDAGITQEELAKKSGIEQTHISRIEVGTHLNVTLKTLERLAKGMKHSIDVVFKKL